MIRYCIGMLERVHAINEKYFLEVNFVHQWIIKVTLLLYSTSTALHYS